MLKSDKLKQLVRKKALQYQVSPQQMYSLYGLEEVLKRLADSPFKNDLIIKGGYLLATSYGLENRSTMDLDATVRNKVLDQELIKQISAYLEQPYPDGAIHFRVKKVRETRLDFDYNGYNLKLEFLNDTMKIPVELDITTGEQILKPVEKELPLIFGDGTLRMPVYQTEQILADKLYTTLAYGAIDDTNSRSKDLYDIYYLTTFQSGLDYRKVRDAVESAKLQRGFEIKPTCYPEIIQRLKNSDYQKKIWGLYREGFPYAAEVTFDQVIQAVEDTVGKTYPEIDGS